MAAKRWAVWVTLVAASGLLLIFLFNAYGIGKNLGPEEMTPLGCWIFGMGPIHSHVIEGPSDEECDDRGMGVSVAQIVGTNTGICCKYGPWAPVFRAVRSGDLHWLEDVLSDQKRFPTADPNAPGLEGKYPIILAIESGNLEMVRLLVDHGAGVNGPAWPLDYVYDSDSSNSPKDARGKAVWPEIREFLIEKGAQLGPNSNTVRENIKVVGLARNLIGTFPNNRPKPFSATNEAEIEAEAKLKQSSSRIRRFYYSKMNSSWKIEFTDASPSILIFPDANISN